MTGIPTFALPGGFLGITRRDADPAVAIAGIALDIATTNRPGARFGPEAIRRASKMLVDGDHPLTRRAVSAMVSDVGDFEIALGDIPASMALIEQQAARFRHLITLGGDHSIALPLLRALAKRHGPVGLVHFDAHVDTWPDSFGQPYGHGSCFYHAINEGIVDPQRMIQIGIRSPVQREVMDWTLGHGVTVLSAQDVHQQGVAAIAERIRAVVGAQAAYLTFDIDALDPAFAPGTGTPEIGGLATWQAQALLRSCGGLNFAGMDMVEVAPAYDQSEITALAAATLVYEYLALLPSEM
ncbi:agmatinase [Ferrovibrio terrae]|uniref:Agmatinase n=1 Tax=Ferrovibrio terrae TaxID=2594003 RepID=A0A516H399_9PROT|nr:agmatinase [Ferrovibrio terrae]QDO98256.1 agmatinase [Ferrovibrio terrae]